MGRIHFVSLAALLFSAAALFAVSEVRAQLVEPFTAGQTCEVTATVKGKTRTLTVRAGVDDTGTPEDESTKYPFPAKCPNDPVNSLKCSLWTLEYELKDEGGNFISMSQSFATVPSGVTVWETAPEATVTEDPSSGDSQSGLGVNVFDQRTIRFNENGSTVFATILTGAGTPEVITVGGHAGSWDAYCGLLGPGKFKPKPVAVAGFATVALPGGNTICTETDPQTGCAAAVDCVTGAPLASVPIGEVLQVGDNMDPVAFFATVGKACEEILIDNGLPNTNWYCSGGRCYQLP